MRKGYFLLVVLFAVTFLTGLLLNGCSQKVKPFDLPALNKKPLNIATVPTFKDHVVVVNVFATWCPPCNDEAPHLNELAKEYKKAGKQVQLIMVDLDSNETPADIAHFYQRLKIDTLAVYDFDMDFLSGFPEINVIPQTFIFNRQGQLSAHVLGVKPKSYFKKLIDNLNP